MQWNIIQPEKRKDILPYATIWMGLEDVMQSEINQTQKDLHVGSKIVQLIKAERRICYQGC